MNKSCWKTGTVCSALTFLALVGGLGCMCTGLELPVSMPLLVLGCAVLSLSFCFFWNTRLRLIPLCLFALLLGYWWQEGSLRLSLESVLYQISDLYDRGYGWGILQWTDRSFLNHDGTLALLALALPIAAILSLTLIKGRFIWLGTLTALLPLASCLVLRDTVPEDGYLALLLFAMVMLTLTGGVRTRNPKQADRLTLLLALPLALGLTLLFSLCPRETYTGQAGAQKLEDWVLSVFEDIELPNGPVTISGDQARTIHLNSVGQREKDSTIIMTVRAQETGPLYLRGCAYDVYDGTSWSSTPGWNKWNAFYTAAGSQVKSLTIQTRHSHSVRYFTYAPYDMEETVVGGRIPNKEDSKHYTVYYQDPETYNSQWDSLDAWANRDELEEYLTLPYKTRQQAQQILERLVDLPNPVFVYENDVWENAVHIAKWVSQRAKYDLNTTSMPGSEKDFAIWFLSNSRSGYCTHFATATVVLLRAAGIPAQYVTGYLVNAQADRTVTVTAAQAHAWVEVFINGVGWVVLEPTPSTGLSQTLGSGDIPTEPSVPTEPSTEPDDPQPSTEPDETTEPEDPVQTTGPSHTTRPQNTIQSQTTESTGNVSQFGGADPGTPARQSFARALLWLLGSILALAVLIIQWQVRVLIQGIRLRRGTTNRRALCHWRLLDRMARLTKTEPPEECFWLAQKAKFSQHTLTDEELNILVHALRDSKRRLQKRNFLCQLVYTLILALY